MSNLDPENWDHIRVLGHRMLDEMLDNIRTVEQQPVWQPPPHAVRTLFQTASLPQTGVDLEALYQQFIEHVVPYAVGNRHPRFMGWVHGGGTAQGMLADMLAAGLNANVGGRNHMPVDVEHMVIRWAAELFGFPQTTTGLLTSGSSMANFVALLTACRAMAGTEIRQKGVGGRLLVGYACESAHGYIPRAFDMAGLGIQALRYVPADRHFKMDITALKQRIAVDRAQGLEPFVIIGTAGTVNVGTIDPLEALADLAAEEKLWFHVDGAFGAMAQLSKEYAPLLRGIERADSLAFDFHKWTQVPYDAGCVLIRHSECQAKTFAQSLDYLSREDRGLAALAGESPWFCDLGPELSRGFRALKVWFALAGFGTEALGEVVERSCVVAHYLETRVYTLPWLELMAPVVLNIVCFRVVVPQVKDLDHFNAELVKDLHESGVAAPSTTKIEGHVVIRVAIVNHRTTERDIDILLEALHSLAFARINSLKEVK
ncbi:MAG: cytochrome D ubiquinol oxidase subunit I [Acetobacter sp.]|nr:cytochrome D ubiquinol oxidase subunit I [Acetobacter sp.]